MQRFLTVALPWFLTAILLGYIAADAMGLFGVPTMAVDGKTDIQREAEKR